MKSIWNKLIERMVIYDYSFNRPSFIYMYISNIYPKRICSRHIRDHHSSFDMKKFRRYGFTVEVMR